jgi:hypothetical protein
MAEDRSSLADRFWAKVDRSAGPTACWPWLGYIGQNRGTGRGYGQIRDTSAGSRGRLLKAHRVALVLKTGRDEPALDACHECDNSVCCNPGHLFWGTHRENMKDYILKYGRVAVEKRPLPPRPKLPFEDAVDPLDAACALAVPAEDEAPF